MKKVELKKGEIVLATVTVNQSEERSHDSRGMRNVVLTPIAGKLPLNARFVAGTIANMNGFGTNGAEGFDSSLTVMLQVDQEYRKDEDGDIATYESAQGEEISAVNNNYTLLAEVLNPLDILKLKNELGRGMVIDTVNAKVSTPEDAPIEQEG